MIKSSDRSKGIKVESLRMGRLTSREFHINLFHHLNSDKSECLVVTHRGEPRMIAFVIDPKIGYAVLAGEKELIFTMNDPKAKPTKEGKS